MWILGSENARILQQQLHYPLDAVLQEALGKNFITDTKVKGADVERAEAIMRKNQFVYVKARLSGNVSIPNIKFVDSIFLPNLSKITRKNN